MSERPGEPDKPALETGDLESAPILLSRSRERSRARARIGATLRPPGTTTRPGSVRGAASAAARSRLGGAGMIVAMLLVLVAVFADLLASELPLVCKLHGSVYLLPNVTRPAELVAMGHDAIARDAEWSVSAIVPHGPSQADTARLASPGKVSGHPLGTDREGRDVFARVVHATRSYLVFALVAVVASLTLGALLGGLAGLFGGTIDAFVSRAIETISAFPPLLLVLGVEAAVPRPTIGTLFFAIAIARWPEAARLVRAEVMLATTRDYVLAARALGASPLRILRRHVAPNVRGPLVVAAAVGIAAVVLTEASLDFLRVGVPGGAASWGETMSQFRDAPGAWWLLAFPGVLLVATVVGYNLVGEAFREALDPRARWMPGPRH